MEAVTAMGATALTPENAVLQFWGNGASWDTGGKGQGASSVVEQHAQLKQALDAGYNVVYSNASAWYLDCGVGNFLTGGASWCNPYKTWQVVLSDEPSRAVPAEKLKQLLGGEVCLWGEQTSPSNLE